MVESQSFSYDGGRSNLAEAVAVITAHSASVTMPSNRKSSSNQMAVIAACWQIFLVHQTNGWGIGLRIDSIPAKLVKTETEVVDGIMEMHPRRPTGRSC